jgi:outer membrane biosynthesis protein TonB
MSNRKKVTLAVVGSVLLHILIILSVSGVNAVWPETERAQAKADETPQMTLLDTAPPQQQERQYVRTNDDQKTDQDPIDSMFESDKSTAAASDQEAKGRAPVPTQDGKEIPDLAFRNEDYSLDTQGSQFSEKPSTEQSQLEAPTPTPTVAPTPTPTPPKEEELAMLRPQPTPAATPPPPSQTRPQRRQSAPRTAYRQQSIINRMQGNITNRGRSSVAALGTPWGRFEKAVQDAVGSRWYYYVAQRSGNMLTPDTVQVKFYVRPDGKVEQPRILGAPANETLASCSLQSVIDAKIPPMPQELVSLVPQSGMEFTFSFTFYLQ